MSNSGLKLFADFTLSLETRVWMGSPGDMDTQLPEVQLAAIYLVSGLLTHVIFSIVFFPFQKYGKKLILCLQDLDHIVSNMSPKQSNPGGQPGVPARPDSLLDTGVGPNTARVEGSPKG